jgi:hypothetical protein
MIRHDTGRGAFMDIGRRTREPRPILSTHFAAFRRLVPVLIRRPEHIHQKPGCVPQVAAPTLIRLDVPSSEQRKRAIADRFRSCD